MSYRDKASFNVDIEIDQDEVIEYVKDNISIEDTYGEDIRKEQFINKISQ